MIILLDMFAKQVAIALLTLAMLAETFAEHVSFDGVHEYERRGYGFCDPYRNATDTDDPSKAITCLGVTPEAYDEDVIYTEDICEIGCSQTDACAAFSVTELHCTLYFAYSSWNAANGAYSGAKETCERTFYPNKAFFLRGFTSFDAHSHAYWRGRTFRQDPYDIRYCYAKVKHV